jgi:hypothetical protein
VSKQGECLRCDVSLQQTSEEGMVCKLNCGASRADWTGDSINGGSILTGRDFSFKSSDRKNRRRILLFIAPDMFDPSTFRHSQLV